MKKYFFLFILFFLNSHGHSQNSIRVAAYGGELPYSLIKKFEQQTGIKVYLSTFESNENLLLKLKSSSKPLYDVITPSNYYVDRFRKLDIIEKIDFNEIANFKHINPRFLPKNSNGIYGIPFVWGATGIFYNKKYIKSPPFHWRDLWSKEFKNQLLLLDDTREVFSVALLSIHKNPNTTKKADINNAYEKLKRLSKNIKLFASDAMPSIIIDEDAVIGMAWNGDIEKTKQENPNIEFIYPKEGFIIWAECFSIPKGASHHKEAYQFINFMIDAKNAAEITQKMKFPVTNNLVQNFLPTHLANNDILYPPESSLKHGILQQDATEEIIKLYNSNWELFKLSL